MPKIVFADIQAYLDAIAANANGNIDSSPHKSFWKVAYATFVNGNVPGVTSKAPPIPVGQPIPIIDKNNPTQSSFYSILLGKFCGIGQMPAGGPFITQSDFAVTIGGKNVTGQDIRDNIKSWLQNGYPET